MRYWLEFHSSVAVPLYKPGRQRRRPRKRRDGLLLLSADHAHNELAPILHLRLISSRGAKTGYKRKGKEICAETVRLARRRAGMLLGALPRASTK